MLNLANKITLARILMTPVVVILLYFEGPVTCLLAAAAFALASLTDWADGYIARRDNLVTSMGKFLDPLADKVLICSVLIMFVELEWMRAMAIDEGIVLAADKFGKAKTVMQIAAIIPLMLHHPYGGVELWHIGEALMYVALALSLFSGANYCYGFYRTTANK